LREALRTAATALPGTAFLARVVFAGLLATVGSLMAVPKD
jgi:hypothetical protein